MWLASVRDGTLPGGWAVDDGVGLLFRGQRLERVVSSRPGAGAQRVDQVAGELVRHRLTPELLGEESPGVLGGYRRGCAGTTARHPPTRVACSAKGCRVRAYTTLTKRGSRDEHGCTHCQKHARGRLTITTTQPGGKSTTSSSILTIKLASKH